MNLHQSLDKFEDSKQLSQMWEPKSGTTQEAINLKTLAWDEQLAILRVHEVHLQNRDHLPKINFTTLKPGETSSRREKKKNSSKALKVQMAESDGSNNNFV